MAKKPDLISSLALVGVIIATFLAACTAEVDTPRLATQAAQTQSSIEPSPTPFLIEAPVSDDSDAESVDSFSQQPSAGADPLVFWANETSTENEHALNEIINNFTREFGTSVDLTLVSNESLPLFVQTATASGTLPDLILHPAEYSAGWVQQGILDSTAAASAVELLRPDTFDPEALNQLRIDSDDKAYAAVPSDLWRMLVIYREDWFAENSLSPPDDYQAISEAAEELFDPEQNRYGLVVPTDAAVSSTQRLFEYMALANGCQLVDQSGAVTFLHPACLEALEYYRAIINQFSPIGLQTEISTLNAYLAGRTGMIVASSSVLPAIAGLEEEQLPTCPDCSENRYLSNNSSMAFEIEGSGEFSRTTSLSTINALGITTVADSESALDFVEHWFDEGYQNWFSVNPERKIPLRHSRPDEPKFYLNEWKNMHLSDSELTISDLFGSKTADILAVGTGNDKRWAVPFGQGEILTLMYQNLIFSPLLQEMLSGYFSSSQTVIEIYNAIVAAIPDYEFPIASEASETPTP